MSLTGRGNTLLDSMAESCVMMDKTTVQTETGGYSQKWVEGVSFQAMIRKDNSLQARVAEKQGITELYTVVVEKGFPIDFHDVFKRGKDGMTYRVTSNIQDNEAPDASTIKIGKVTAERWDIPNA